MMSSVCQTGTVEEVSAWLAENRFPLETIDAFQDNYIDGDSLLSLTNSEISSLVPQLGLQKRLQKLLRLSSCVSDDTSSLCYVSDSLSSTPKTATFCSPEVSETGVPDPVPLPRFSTTLSGLIKSGKLGVQKQTNDRFVEECVIFYTSFRAYLTSEYDRISQAIVDRYPQWSDPFGKCYWFSFKTKFAEAVRYRRKRGKRILQPDASGSGKKGKFNYKGMKVELKEEEDYVTYEDKVQRLQEESKKVNPDWRKKLELFRSTCEQRRLWIKETQPALPVKAILDKFPCLCDSDWVLEEFKLIIGEEKLHAATLNWAKDFRTLLGDLDVDCSGVPNWLTQIKAFEYIELQTSPRSGKKYVSNIITAVKPGEPITLIIAKQQTPEPTVIVVEDGKDVIQFMIIIEREVLFMIKVQEKSFFELIYVLFATYYTFWLTFPYGPESVTGAF